MDLGRALGDRLVHRTDDRQGLVVDLDGGRGGQRLLARLGGHDGDRVPDVAHPVFAEHGPVGDHVVVAVRALDVGRGHDAGDAGHGGRRARVDAADQGVGVRAVHGGQLERPGQRDVGRELGHAAGLDHGRGARVRDADLGTIRVGVERGGLELAAQEAPGQLDGVDDLDVAGAAAEVVAQGVPDLLGRGIGVLVEQRLGRHDHAGDAEAALHGSGQHEGLLDRGAGWPACRAPRR